ncbi:LytR C-terminal domain-containing protein [Isoptericola hypogeus]|uniref:LytR C-terminal domain-containing protein n=1 Tax=Isoptericola hypogeus TaxID=300179 RepID=UPI0031D27EC9
MSKSQYSYPPDEFDVRGPEGSPVGVHREPRSGWSSVWPFLLVAVVCGGIAVGAVSFLSNDEPSNPPAAEQSEGGAAGTDEPTTEESPSDDASSEPTDGESEEPTDDGDGATELPGDPAAASLDAPVMVFNDIAGDAAAGQAAAGQGVLADAGFAEVTAADVPDTLDDVYDETTVLYGADRADTASGVAEALGVDPANVQESDDVSASPEAVWVVLKEPVG